MPPYMPPLAPGCQWMALFVIGRKDKKKPALRRVQWMLLDGAKRGNGGDGGNRTRVRKSSASQFYMRSLSMVSPIALRQTGRLWVEPALI